MRSPTRGPLVPALLFLAAFAIGCTESTPRGEGPIEISGPPPAIGVAHHHDHGHGSHHQGPHGGHVIELGRDHQYHVELVEDETSGTVTAHILDNTMQELAIDQQKILVNLVEQGRARSVELTSGGAPGEKSSKFSVTDAPLIEALHRDGTSAKLRVTIGGTPYVGELGHTHRHAGRHGHRH